MSQSSARERRICWLSVVLRARRRGQRTGLLPAECAVSERAFDILPIRRNRLGPVTAMPSPLDIKFGYESCAR
jgi:hypothetical protein